jgi:hypothetical protein
MSSPQRAFFYLSLTHSMREWVSVISIVTLCVAIILTFFRICKLQFGYKRFAIYSQLLLHFEREFREVIREWENPHQFVKMLHFMPIIVVVAIKSNSLKVVIHPSKNKKKLFQMWSVLLHGKVALYNNNNNFKIF